jgi:hypothetical protein
MRVAQLVMKRFREWEWVGSIPSGDIYPFIFSLFWLFSACWALGPKLLTTPPAAMRAPYMFFCETNVFLQVWAWAKSQHFC